MPFPNSACGNGTATGIGVNLKPGATRVLLYLEGGGACWSDVTCYSFATAANFNGYGASNFQSDVSGLSAGSFFDRTDATNPFKDYSFVYVPYCTGDIHAGNNVVTYSAGHTAHHVGFANMAAYLQRLVPTFPLADRVILAGSSAGGFGALFNWVQTQQAFGSIRVDMIDDSGTLMPADVPAHGYESAQRASWNLAATTPAGCTGCATDYDAIIGFSAQAFPTHRAAFLSYTQDSVLPTFSGITTQQFQTGLEEQESTNYATNTNIRFFSKDASGHVLWFSPTLTQNSVTVRDFVTQMVTDDPNWASVDP